MAAVFSAPGTIFASARMDEVRNYLEQGEDKQAVILLEEYFADLAGEKNVAQRKQPGSDFLAAGYLLADMYAWRMKNPGRALEIYRVIDQSANGTLGHGLFHKLFVAEIYAHLNKDEEALQQLNDLLEEVTGEIDRESGQLFAGVDDLIRYRMDSITLKNRAGKQDLALPEIRLPVLKGMAANPFIALWAHASGMGSGLEKQHQGIEISENGCSKIGFSTYSILGDLAESCSASLVIERQIVTR